MAYQHIEVDLKEGLGTITLNRPPVNVLNIAMMEEINAVLQEWQGKKDLKIVLFNAKGKCFSAGVDVGEHMGDLAPKMIGAFHRIFRLMDGLGAVTVASVFSSCLGGGCELAIFCDIAISSESGKFGQPEIQVGVFPPIAAQLMPRTIGRKAAMDLILSGRIITAEEAMRIGLINKVVATGELRAATRQWCETIKGHSPQTLRATKKSLNHESDELYASWQHGMELLANIWGTEESLEGMQAFLDKRKPDFQKFRLRSKAELDRYLAGLARDENQAPAG